MTNAIIRCFKTMKTILETNDKYLLQLFHRVKIYKIKQRQIGDEQTLLSLGKAGATLCGAP